MERVYKYPLAFVGGVQTVELPLGAEVLHFAMQGEGSNPSPTIWAKVNPEHTKEVRGFFLRGTGHEMGFEAAQHIGTVLHGAFVWHLFELRRNQDGTNKTTN